MVLSCQGKNRAETASMWHRAESIFKVAKACVVLSAHVLALNDQTDALCIFFNDPSLSLSLFLPPPAVTGGACPVVTVTGGVFSNMRGPKGVPYIFAGW